MAELHGDVSSDMERRNKEASALDQLSQRYLFPQFTRLSREARATMKVIARGEGCYVFDSRGERYLDGTAGHFCVNVGHGREELAQAAAEQFEQIAYWSNWGWASPPAIALAARLAALTPGDLNRSFLTSGGSEAVESALKLARHYHRVQGDEGRIKVIARHNAYHGTSLGALAMTGIPSVKTPYEPLMPGASHVPSTPSNLALGEPYRPPPASWIEERIELEGPETVAAVILEPMQNVGGCLAPSPEYFGEVRSICDQHGVLLIVDEVICGWGRLGHWFGGDRYGAKPDIVTVAKGLASGYAPIGAMIASDRLLEPFIELDEPFAHGFTFGGHPIAAAIALENLNILERERLCERVLEKEQSFRRMLESLSDIAVVGEIRGAGFFWAIEVLRDSATRTPFDPETLRDVVRGFLDPEFKQRGLICRPDDRVGGAIQLAPALVADETEFGEMEARLRDVLKALERRVQIRSA